LYVVATPIGNLEDITLRALKTLAAVDVIAAEDTRNTATLLARHGIGTRLVSLHRHNEAKAVQMVLGLLHQGKNVALVSDAGTPAISDPGAHLVEQASAAGLRVTPIPGASAAIAAYSACGLPESPILFYGFLPARQGARRKAIGSLAALQAALIFYEAPHRILECVADLAGCLEGERTLVLARELTKVYESIHSCALAAALEWLRADTDRQRGEFVVIVSGAPAARRAPGADWAPALATLLAELPLAQAVKLTCALTGARRSVVYPRALELAKKL
jgi:16S rRNA (cytidine1402-2'-O)-methyltransferase